MRSAKKYSADATGAGAQRSVAGRSGAACGARGRSKRKRAAQSIHNADRGIAAGAAQYPERLGAFEGLDLKTLAAFAASAPPARLAFYAPLSRDPFPSGPLAGFQPLIEK